jgi:hypothetical protein
MKKTSLLRRAFIRRAAATSAGIAILAGCTSAAFGECVPFDGTLRVSSNFPCDTFVPAPRVSLFGAAKFAWQEFFALNWPADVGSGTTFRRERPSSTLPFGDPSYDGPLVWHTFRGKVEIYPGVGDPPGYQSSGADDFGYDFPPQYVYAKGDIPPGSKMASAPTPWINLDENSQIGLNQIFVGNASSITDHPKNQILFMAKANREEYAYIASRKWWNKDLVPFEATAKFIQANQRDPEPYPNAEAITHVSFPNNSVEIKAAWRKLSPNDKNPSHYYQTTVRYYYLKDPKQPDKISYQDEKLALVGLHIIHKTPTAPYFIYATFEQADNILDANGNPVENADGERTPGQPGSDAMTPAIASVNAMGTKYQTFNISGQFPDNPGKQLYYQNTLYAGLPTKGYQAGIQGSGHGPQEHEELSNILVNHRINAIPFDIIQANISAHNLITSYAESKKINPLDIPWQYYKLVNVQFKPIDKDRSKYGSDYTKDNASTYYQSNSTIETSYNIQKFSGRFYAEFDSGSPRRFTITDFDASGNKFQNVIFDHAAYNMGGCMGCHGNAQHAGSGFSFILKNGRVSQPEVANSPIDAKELARLSGYFSK